jgi:hypothetical protein
MIVASIGWPLLRLLGGNKKFRALAMSVPLVLQYIWLYKTFDQQTVTFMAILFFWLQFGFTFRYFSSLFWYRADAALPSYGFFVALTLFGPRQHYGAGSWKDLEGNRFGLSLIKEFLPHFLYSISVSTIAFGLWQLQAHSDIPFKLGIQRSVVFIWGLELLTLAANLEILVWSFFGKQQLIFGNFAWYTSKHIGQYWARWNTLAIMAFREMSTWLHLTRRHFLNTMTVFAISGVLHQLIISYYTRKLTYGTLLSFLIHGMLVYGFSVLYRKRKKMPRAVALVLFNPLTSAIVVLLASQPFVMDLYGQSFILWDPSAGG